MSKTKCQAPYVFRGTFFETAMYENISYITP